MLKMVIGIFIALFAAFLFFLNYNDNAIVTADKYEAAPVSTSSIIHKEEKVEVSLKNDEVSLEKVEALVSVPEKKSVEEKSKVDSIEQNDEAFFSQFTRLTKNDFQTPMMLTSAFLNENGNVSKAALEDAFNASDFNELIHVINSIDKTENGTARENLLSERLYKLDNLQVHSETYSCSGKICLVSFDFEGDESSATELSNFTKNYSFTNIVDGDNGFKKFKAIYIQTDDPSTLTLSY
ncbi:Uncharacterised protein [Shewanella putrefaciens]|nr:Uncharacterised protein [Shewanella putrefaciens]